MIVTPQEYEITKDWVEKFELKLRSPLPAADPLDPRGREIERNAIAATISARRSGAEIVAGAAT